MKIPAALPATLLLFFLVAAPALGGPLPADTLQSPKLRASLKAVEALGAGQGRFLVLLQATRTAGPGEDLSTEEGKAAARARTAAALDAFFSRRQASDTGQVTRTFAYVPAFAATLSAEQVAALVASDAVAAVEEDVVLHPHLRQGIPLMNALASRPAYDGTGVSVAVCDTGVDYNNSYLGGPGFPNARVIGGKDTGLDVADPMDTDGHGTACAGIVAGAIGDTGNYIGGVAPGAKIYALKITDASGKASDSSLVAAWEWSISHQNDAPTSPIRIINVSFGGGYYTSACDTDKPTLAASAGQVAAAGITLFASSGNEGYCNGMGDPACLSGAISVGAVYDAAFGTSGACVEEQSCASKQAEPGCSTGYHAEDASAADKVPSYSNSASFLTLFAPADKCYTLQCASKGSTFNDSFGGTSAASPYAAGAAAALQSAAKRKLGRFLTPAQVKAVLIATGTSVTDGKVAVTKPRVSLQAAINALATGGVNLLPLSIPASIRKNNY